MLEIRDARFAYGGREVLRGVSLSVATGETVALVGPNGAGKTTLLRIVSGWLVPSGGVVRVEGVDLAGMPRRLAARLVAGVAAEEEATFPYTVRDTVSLGRHAWHGALGGLDAEDEALVDAALRRVGVEHLAARPLPGLSSGERQRAAIARGLVQDARVLLLDEPTAHLDLGHRLRMLEVVRDQARERGQAALAVLHDLNLAAAVADRIVLLKDGRVVADGTPAEVLTADRLASAFEASVHVLAHPTQDGPVIVPIGGAPGGGSGDIRQGGSA